MNAAQGLVATGGQRLLDQLDATLSGDADEVLNGLFGPCFVGIDKQPRIRTSCAYRSHAAIVTLSSELQFQKRELGDLRGLLGHRCWRVETESESRYLADRGRQAGKFSDAHAGAFAFEIPECAVEGIERGARVSGAGRDPNVLR